MVDQNMSFASNPHVWTYFRAHYPIGTSDANPLFRGYMDMFFRVFG